jgi:hypothetical protein
MTNTGKTTSPAERSGFSGPFAYLLLVILAMILTTPFLQDYLRIRILLDVFYTAIFLAALYLVSQEKRLVKLAVVLAVPMIFSLWASYFIASDHIVTLGRVCGIVFFALAIYHCGRFILKSPQVTRDVIIAAVVIYLLMALMWSYAYALLEFYQPGSFNALEGLTSDSRQFFLYYSFVTLTTLGFGDITPLTEKAKSLTILQAFIGQVYLVVVLAWLVGMHVSRKSK